MPSEDYNRFTDVDVAALIAYLRSMPPVAGEGASFQVPLPVKALYAAGVIKDAAEKIDHSLPPATPVAEGVTAEHGKYVANLVSVAMVRVWQGQDTRRPPDWPAASNSRRTGTVMTAYDTADKLKAMFRSGKRANGTSIAVMPSTRCGSSTTPMSPPCWPT